MDVQTHDMKVYLADTSKPRYCSLSYIFIKVSVFIDDILEA